MFHVDLLMVCAAEVVDHEPGRPSFCATLMRLEFSALKLRSDPNLNLEDSKFLTVDRIYVLSVDLGRPWVCRSSTSMECVMALPWDKISRMCAEQDIRLNLEFQSRNDLTEFMEYHRAALAKLDGRICVAYMSDKSGLLQVHPETLIDLEGTPVALYPRLVDVMAYVY